MPTYEFTAVDGEGRTIEGTVTDRDEVRALDRLRKSKAKLEVQNLRPVRRAGLAAWAGRLRPVSRDEMARLFQQMSMALTVGIGLARAVQMLRQTGFSPRLSDALDDVERRLHMGSRLSEALARFPALFSREVVGTIRVAEETGNLDETLRVVATMLEKDAARARRLQAALAYPAMLLAVSLAMMAAMVLFFLPRMADVIRSFHLDLPLPLRVLMGLGDLAANPLYAAFAVETVVFVAGMAWFWLQTEAGREWWDETVLRIPIVNRVIVSVALTRLAYAMGLMTGCGMGVTQAMQLVAGTLGNRVLDGAVADAREYVLHGATLAQAFRAQPPIETTFASMVEVGEESGRIEEAMERLQRIYEERVDHLLDTAASLVEPLILLVMGGVVGGTVLLFMLPLVSLLRSL